MEGGRTEKEGEKEEKAVPSLGPGSRLRLAGQRWKVVRQLGKGSYGLVFLITKGTTRVAAIKISVKDIANDWNMAWEGYVLRHLHETGHGQNIIGFQGEGIGEELESRLTFRYVAMDILHPYCGTLADLVRMSPGKKLEPAKAAKIGMMILRGVYEMHMAGLLHRDLKPDNVGILPEPNDHSCVLLDLGMARFYTDGDGELRSPRSYPGGKGTASFMSQRVVGNREVGRVDDLWSWFYTLVELMKGEMFMPWDEIGVIDGEEHEADHMRLKSRECTADIMLKGLPEELYAIRFHLICLNYEDPPDYLFIFRSLASILDKAKTSYPRESLVPQR